ncbi:MAG: M23 family metallopeptidase [Bacteroidetes bacterium]|nr:M23 family metallopeptidase [Bacteroidota bacterium]
MSTSSIMLLIFFFLQYQKTHVFSQLCLHNDEGEGRETTQFDYREIPNIDVLAYQWPTSSTLPVTSAFGDFRLTHFHGGIDISTHGRTGYPVFASNKGTVVHISVSPYGYGKMLLIRHPDGLYTRYAHLKSFAPQLERMVRSYQRQKGVYPVELSLNDSGFCVERGEVIAYTGNTGAGDEHLHFEILDHSMNFIDPMLFPAIAAKVHDTYKPEFRKVAFIPLTEESRVNGRIDPVIVDVYRTQRGQYTCSSTMYIQGKIGVCVRAVDRFSATTYRNQCKHFISELNGIAIFSSTIKIIPRSGYRGIAFYYDYELLRNGEMYFQKLYVDLGNKYSMVTPLPEGSGIIDAQILPPGQHELKVTAIDDAQNTSILTVTLVPLHNEEPPYRLYTKHFSQPAPTTHGNENTCAEYSISFLKKDPLENSLRVSVLQQRTYFIVKLHSHLPFTLRPSLWLVTPTRTAYVDLNAETERSYFGTINFLPFESGNITIVASADINGAKNIACTTGVTVVPIDQEKKTIVFVRDATFTFPPFAVPTSIHCIVDSLYLGYSLKPDILPLTDDVEVEYHVPDSLNRMRIGLFHASVIGNKLLDWRRPEGKKILKGKMRAFLGDIVLRIDETPPKVSFHSIRYRNGILRCLVRVSDETAGVDPEELRLQIDGMPLIGEYDPYRGLLQFEEEYPLAPGVHIVTITAHDKMGNATYVEEFFTVKRGSERMNSK